MKTNHDEIVWAANALLRTLGFDPDEVRELHLEPGPVVTVVHYVDHPTGQRETVTRHVRLTADREDRRVVVEFKNSDGMENLIRRMIRKGEIRIEDGRAKP